MACKTISLKNKLKENGSEDSDNLNGIQLNDHILPDEIIQLILSNCDGKTLLNCRLVCKKWCELIISRHFWRLKVNKPVKNHIPWYVYYGYVFTDFFDTNLLLNGNGQYKFKDWKLEKNGGDGWIVEQQPLGADPLPANVPDFDGHLCCFASSFQSCQKKQIIYLGKHKLLKKILKTQQPAIYISEWFAGRFDCGCKYRLVVTLLDEEWNLIYEKEETRVIQQWHGQEWNKVEIICENYGKNLQYIIFFHEGVDTQFWAGHYGSKMAGGIVKILFDSID